MYSMDVSISTVSIIVGDDALGVPFGEVRRGFGIYDVELFGVTLL